MLHNAVPSPADNAESHARPSSASRPASEIWSPKAMIVMLSIVPPPATMTARPHGTDTPHAMTPAAAPMPANATPMAAPTALDAFPRTSGDRAWLWLLPRPPTPSPRELPQARGQRVFRSRVTGRGGAALQGIKASYAQTHRYGTCRIRPALVGSSRGQRTRRFSDREQRQPRRHPPRPTSSSTFHSRSRPLR
jgi:hypothetical protein